MSLLDKAKSWLSQNKDKADDGVDKAGSVADERTGGKYTNQVDTGEQRAKDFIEKTDDQ